MKNFKWLKDIAFLFLCVFMLCWFQSCSDDENEKTGRIDYSQLIGVWKEMGTYGDYYLLQIKENGIAMEYEVFSNGGYKSYYSTYTINNGKLRIIDNWGDEYVYEIRSVTSSQLVLYDIEYGEEEYYTRYYGELPNTGNNNNGNNNNSGNNSGSYDDEPTTINPPTNVQAYVNNGEVTITWQSVSGASAYSVWRSSSANGSYSKLVFGVSGTSHTDSYPNVGYNYYKVKALGGGDIESNFSSYTSVYVEKKEETPIVQKPDAPTGVTVSNVGNNYYPDVVIRWNEVSGADKYYVYRSSSANGSYSKIATVQWNVYTDDAAPTNKASYYKVKAVNSAGESPYSSYAKYTPAANSGGSGGNEDDNGSSGTKTKLDAPTNLDYASDLYYVQISFDEVPLAYQYELYRSNSAYSGYTKITASGGSISGGRYVLTDSNPKSGTTYYKVKAKALSYLGIQDSDYSSYIKVTR